MTNEITTQSDNVVPMDILAQMEEKNEVAKKEGGSGGGTWIPSVQIMQSGTKLRRELKAEEGAMVLRAKSPIILPASIDFLMVTLETVAKDFSDGVIFSNDENSAVFQDIKARADEDPAESGCCYGPEYLVYLAEYGWATWHATNATLRNVLSELNQAWGQCFSASTELITKKKYQWYGPVLGKCANAFALPSEDEIRSTYLKWKESLSKGSVATEEDTGDREV